MNNSVASKMNIIGFLLIILGVMSGFISIVEYGYAGMFLIMGGSVVSGMMFIGLSEVISLLQQILDGQKAMRESKANQHEVYSQQPIPENLAEKTPSTI